MPIARLDAEKCRRRNFSTAMKGRNAAPVRFLLSPPSASTSAVGTLPADDAEALARINAILGREGDKALAPADVHLVYPEVGNTNYIDDRCMFLGRKTLRNVAAMATDGFAFMNSHRTGDVSTPSELPFGRTFAGRYETTRDAAGNLAARAVVGAYMLRGLSPNGGNGPTTDDLYAGIAGGTIFDVSLGLYGGEPICDVCGEGLYARDLDGGALCPHVPGTHRKMSEEDAAAQVARGVPDGVATYTLDDARPGEFSAVYDGAVPGAGFRKAVAFARAGRLSGRALSEARHAYRSLLIPGDRRAGRLSTPKGMDMPSLLDIFRNIKVQPDDAAEFGLDDPDDAPARRREAPAPTDAPPPPADPALAAELAKLREQNEALGRALESERLAREEKDRKDKEARDAAEAGRLRAGARDAALALVNAGKLLPAGSAAFESIHAYAHLSAAGLPTDGLDLAASVAALPGGMPPHSLTREQVADAALPEGVRQLAPSGPGPTSEARKKEILKSHPLGAAALAHLNS